MAITTLYFGASSAGAADGTTWADRAAFVSGGAVNTLISAFDFTTNSLVAMVGPGTHTLTTGIATFTGATAPTFKIPCIIQACDSNGAQWVPPNPGWVSAEPVWDTSGMPVIATTTNIKTIDNGSVACRGIKFTSSGATTNTALDLLWLDWCELQHSGSNSAASGMTVNTLTNTCATMSGSSYSYAISGSTTRMINVRCVGNLSASSGNRYGIQSTSSGNFQADLCTVVNHVGGGIFYTSSSTAIAPSVKRTTIANCGSHGIYTNGTGTGLTMCVVNCMITGNGGWGVNSANTGTGMVANSRIRDNSSGAITGLDGWPTDQDNDMSSGTDSNEYVNVTGLDFRIKSLSSLWGKGYGAGDQNRQVDGALSVTCDTVFSIGAKYYVRFTDGTELEFESETAAYEYVVAFFTGEETYAMLRNAVIASAFASGMPAGAIANLGGKVATIDPVTAFMMMVR